MRLFARAFARAELPVRYTEGFNPHPKISLPLPRPVGVASDDERLVTEFTERVAPSELVRRLAAEMPAGITVTGSHELEPGDRSVPMCVRYRVDTRGFDRTQLVVAAARLMREEPILYDRYVHKTSQRKSVDLRPYVESIDVGAEHVLMSLRVTASGSARPAEICELLGMGAADLNHLIRRVEITWQRKHKPTDQKRKPSEEEVDVVRGGGG